MQSGQSESGGPVTQRTQSLAASDTRSKHRIQAELKRLEQEARFLEEELELLEKTDKASAACNEILINVEKRPDPLLPVTNGPLNPLWDRWFEGLQDSKGCNCWKRCKCWTSCKCCTGCKCWTSCKCCTGCKCWTGSKCWIL